MMHQLSHISPVVQTGLVFVGLEHLARPVGLLRGHAALVHVQSGGGVAEVPPEAAAAAQRAPLPVLGVHRGSRLSQVCPLPGYRHTSEPPPCRTTRTHTCEDHC